MAECSVARCVQERRYFRKELHKWHKDIMFLLGMERIAEEIMGQKKWKLLTQPFTDLEPSDVTNWSPEKTCYFCDHKKEPLYDPAGGLLTPLEVLTDDQSTSSDTTPASWQPSPSPPNDQPLDLSLKNRLESEDEDEELLRVPQLKTNQKKRLDGNIKRSYTEDELQAALRDIQSGKLGTRRAAVIYGIPRSTLRNKVYKLALSRTPSTPAIKNNRDSAVSDSLKQLLKSTISQKMMRSASETHLEPLLSQVFSNIHHLALGKNNHSNETIATAALSQDVPLLPHLIRRLAEEQFERANLPHVILNIPSYKANPSSPSSPASPLPPSSISPPPPKYSGDAKSSEKRCRPKRGRYRNYDRDKLQLAVRAVQRGEMSVHRAGTFYGVPHSTLEYKVKERHLLRPRKREGKCSHGQTPPAVKENSVPLPGKPPSTLWPNSSMPFFSLMSESNNFFATQMMRKLQENALLHEEGETKNGRQLFRQENEALLESLIKSTLERRCHTEE